MGSTTRLDALEKKILLLSALEFQPLCSQPGSVLVHLKNAALWDVVRRDSYKNRRFGGTYRLRHQVDKNRRSRDNVSSN
jgi:hypothetical protein